MTSALSLTGPLTFADVRDYVRDALLDLEDPIEAAYSPGPASDAGLQKISQQRIAFLTVGGGAGLTKEQLFDRPFIAVRSIGKQNDYDDAEAFALAIDRALLKLCGNATVGRTRTLYFTRTGGRPQLLMMDSGSRYHFTCSYISESESGL